MSKNLSEKHFDVRTSHRYLQKGVINAEDVVTYKKSLANDEDNFELTVFEDEDDLDVIPEDEDDDIVDEA